MNYKKLLPFIAIFLSTAVNADKLTCPATVKVGKPLVVAATFSNNDCYSDSARNGYTIKNLITSLIGNSGSAGSAGIQGPFFSPLTGSVPGAQCRLNSDFDFWEFISEGSLSFSTITVIKKIPATMVGKLALASVGVLDDKNKLHLAACSVTVTK